MLTDRINTLSESITIAITTLAQEFKAQGKDILSFQQESQILVLHKLLKMQLLRQLMKTLPNILPLMVLLN